MFDWLIELVSGSPATYPVTAAFVALDAFFPVVPGETLVIAGAVLAERGSLSLALVFASGWLGALVGDNVSYALGSLLGRPAAARLFRGERSRRILGWSRAQLEERGRTLIVAGRFVPGGRTAVTFASGMLGMPWSRFLPADLAGATLWAGYATALGYLGGEAFRESVWKPLLAALVVATLVAGAGELWRRRSRPRSGESRRTETR